MERIVRGIVGSVVLATLGALLLSGVELSEVVGRPFAGFVFRNNGDVGPRVLTSASVSPEVGRLRPQDRLVAVDGEPVAHGNVALARIAARPVGTPVRYTFERGGRERFDAVIPTVPFAWSDALRLFGPFLIGGFLLVALTGLVVALRPGDERARVLFTLGAAMGTGLGVLMVDGFLGYRLGPEPQLVGLAVTKASIFHLALLWPDRRWPLSRWPRAVPVFLYGWMLLHTAVYRIAYYDAPRLTTLLAHVTVATFTVGMMLLVVNIARAALAAPDAGLRRASRVVLSGPAIGIVMGALLFLNTWVFTQWSIPPLLFLLPIWVTMATLGYAIVRLDLFAIDAMVRRVLVLAIQGVGAAVAYLVTLLVADRLAGGATGWTAATLFAAALLVAIPAAAPLRRRAEAAAAQLFPRQ
ncbi:MAG: hypothetical protein DCC71_14375, partial [Proteobacteria bacterium]